MNNIKTESREVSQYINKIYCGDSLEFLKLLPDNCVQAIVTSPPYY